VIRNPFAIDPSLYAKCFNKIGVFGVGENYTKMVALQPIPKGEDSSQVAAFIDLFCHNGKEKDCWWKAG